MGAQAIAAVIIAAILTAGAGVVYGLMPKLKNSAALEEVSILAHATAEAAFYVGTTDLTFTKLVTNGYVDNGSYTTGKKENEYGNDITVTGTSASNVVTFTYGTDAPEECLYIKSQLARKVPSMNGAATCTTTAPPTLSFNIDKIRG